MSIRKKLDYCLNRNSLLKLTNREIKLKYPFLIQSRRQRFMEHLVSNKSPITIIIITLVLFFLCFLRVELNIFTCLNFIDLDLKITDLKTIDLEPIGRLVDQRTSNIASIISISLAVATFILNNITKKKPEYYELLFRETAIFPIVYFAFTVLCVLISLSLFKGTFKNKPMFYCDATILCHYLLIAVIFLIGYLFNKIIKVFDPNYLRNERLKKALIDATYEAILFEEQKDISSDIYKNKTEKYTLPQNYSLLTLKEAQFQEPINLERDENKIIKDIKINSLVKVLKKASKTPVVITNTHLPFISLNYNLSWGLYLFRIPKDIRLDINKVKKCYFIEAIPNYKLSFNSLSKSLYDDVLKAIKDDNLEEVENILSEYYNIFESYFKYNIIRLQNGNKLEIENQGYFINSLKEDFQEILNFVVKKGKYDLYKKIFDFIYKIISDSYTNRSLQLFRHYISFYKSIYPEIRLNNAMKKNMVNQRSKDLTNLFSNYMQYDINENTDNETILLLNKFSELYLHSYAQYLYSILIEFDVEDFIEVFKQFNQLNQSLNDTQIDILHKTYSDNINNDKLEQNKYFWDNYEKKFYIPILHFQIILALQFWLHYQYKIRLSKITEGDENSKMKLKADVVNATQSIQLFYPYSRGLVYESYLLVNNPQPFFGIWGTVRNEEGNVSRRFSQFDTRFWLKFGFTIEAIKNYRELTPEFFKLNPQDTRLWDWVSEIEENFKYIEDHFDDWKELINCNDLVSFEEKKQIILDFFFDLKKQYVTNKELLVALEELSKSRIEGFKDEVSKSWRKSSQFLQLFEDYGILKIHSDHKGLLIFGYNNFQRGFKTMFVEKNYQQIFNQPNWGSDVGRLIENSLWIKVTESQKEVKQYSTVFEGLEESVKILRQKEMNPNLIIMGSSAFRFSELLDNRNTFQFNPNGHEDFIHRAKYETINVAMSISRFSSNKIIVCDASKAFELNIYENEDWIDKRLYINVEALTDEMVKEQFERDPKMWKDDGNGIELTDEEALTRVKNTVIIKIYQKAKFKILDSDAFEIFTVSRKS